MPKRKLLEHRPKRISPAARATDAAIRVYLARGQLESQVRTLRARMAPHSPWLIVGGGFAGGALFGLLPKRSIARFASMALSAGAVVLQSISAPFLVGASARLAEGAQRLVDRTKP